VPEILPLCDFEPWVKRDWGETLKLLFWENEQRQSLREAHEKYAQKKSVLLAIGPEGGFAAQEADLAQSNGFEPIQIGRRILRAETAAVAALSLVQFLWGDLR